MSGHRCRVEALDDVAPVTWLKARALSPGLTARLPVVCGFQVSTVEAVSYIPHAGCVRVLTAEGGEVLLHPCERIEIVR